MIDLDLMGKRAKLAARALAVCGTVAKNNALRQIADELRRSVDEITAANERDIVTAREMGVPEPMIDRLRMTPERINAMADAVLEIETLSDPIGNVIEGFTRPNGLNIKKVTVPLGVIGIIFESRPNVTVDAATLCLKSGNATILRGGKEALQTNTVLCKVMRKALKAEGLPEDSVQLVEDTTRESSTALMQLSDLDVLIPRGGKGLIRAVVENAKVPVIETGAGNCHVYVDEYADFVKAVKIVNNAKTSRVSVCNAIEGLLVHEAVADTVLPMIANELKKSNVEIRGCEKTLKILGDLAIPATDEDYATEYLDYIISVKVVSSLDEAVEHIMKYTSGHSECIVTENFTNANRFTESVDAAAVYVNASTRFTDGGEFGFGAEIGISTQKLHARGPMGLRELTSVKYIVTGDGQIR
ncbi:MAG: glutamate-5-semialdehyde dehydrogenase [Acutalibacteraceae bacterium]|nr:glutamate-5-semialdehyde dehydrogenase [Acutalibacteraceae bacterium]